MESYIIGFLVVVAILVVLASKSKSKKKEPNNRTIVQNDDLVVTLDLDKYSGVVSSIKKGNVEFVNSHDHGRLFQTALQLDGYGECHNPTEAGGYYDVGTNKSTSVLRGISKTSHNIVSTEVQAASWGTAPDGKNFCEKGPDPRLKGRLTDTIISKRIVLDSANTIDWFVSIKSNAAESMNIEVLTGYLPATLNEAWFVKNKKLFKVEEWVRNSKPGDGYDSDATMKPGSIDEKCPVIWSTPDGSSALGVYRVDKPKKGEATAYHLLKFDFGSYVGPDANSCVKFSVLSSGPLKVLTNNPSYHVRLVIGTLDQVHKELIGK